jgi:hypothetical protein
MPIRINLLAEYQAAEEMRRRDPVKRALWAAGVFVTLVLCESGWLQIQVGYAANDLAKYEARWVKLEQGCKRVTDNLQQTADIERKLSALHQLAANRFLWAPPLNALQNVMMENVQVTRLRSSQSYLLTAEIKPTEKDGKAIPGKSPTSTEKIGLTIEGKDFSNPAGSQVNQYKQALTAFGYFNEQLKKVDGVRLTELSAPQSDPNDTAKSFVLFTLSCVYPEKLRSNKHE